MKMSYRSLTNRKSAYCGFTLRLRNNFLLITVRSSLLILLTLPILAFDYKNYAKDRTIVDKPLHHIYLCSDHFDLFKKNIIAFANFSGFGAVSVEDINNHNVVSLSPHYTVAFMGNPSSNAGKSCLQKSDLLQAVVARARQKFEGDRLRIRRLMTNQGFSIRNPDRSSCQMTYERNSESKIAYVGFLDEESHCTDDIVANLFSYFRSK